MSLSFSIKVLFLSSTAQAPHRSNGRVPTAATATERKNQMSLAEIPRSADGQKSNKAGDQAPVAEEKSLLRSPYEDLPVDIGSVAVELEAKEGLVNGGRRTETAADGIGGTKKKLALAWETMDVRENVPSQSPQEATFARLAGQAHAGRGRQLAETAGDQQTRRRRAGNRRRGDAKLWCW
jgi:hypothetical protein